MSHGCEREEKILENQRNNSISTAIVRAALPNKASLSLSLSLAMAKSV
jgi:hypothetical protein